MKILFAGMLLALAIPFPALSQDPLRIHCIDVGQGSSELIIGPYGTTILIDGGTGSAGSGDVVPYLNAIFGWRKRINYVIASHDDADHIGGLLYVLGDGGYSADTIYHCGINTDFKLGTQIPLGQVIDLGNGARATCVGRKGSFIDGSTGGTSDNNASVCLLIEYGGFDYITAGDLESNESVLAGDLLTSGRLDPTYGVDVIHVNHHGSDGSSRVSYVNALKHELAVINGGTNYGHPRWTAVDRLKGRVNYSDGSGATGVTWTGCNNVYRTTYDVVEDGRAPEWDCPTLGDMVITYDGHSPNYSLNGTAYPIDEPIPPTPTPTPPIRDIRINEILAKVPWGLEGDANGDGVRDAWQDEFIELVNWTGHAVDLGGWTVSDSVAVRFTFPGGTSLQSGQALVLFGGGTPAGDFGGSVVLTAAPSEFGLYLTDDGDTVTLMDGEEIIDQVTYGDQIAASNNRRPELWGSFQFHNQIPEASGSLYSPGTKADGSGFGYSPPPGWAARAWIRDYDGDGTSDIAVFRKDSGLWAVRSITRAYFGGAEDSPVPGDYDGDGATDMAVFRAGSGLWAARGGNRVYFGGVGDIPVPGDYDADGTTDIGIFRKASGLWAVRGVTRTYFGGSSDEAAPGYYGDDGRKKLAIFRPASGLWVIRGITRVYFGSSGDIPIPGDYDADGSWNPGIYRPDSGLWAALGATRFYFGSPGDSSIPGGYRGDGQDYPGIFRDSSGLWVVPGVTRAYFGSGNDTPVAR